MQRAHQKSLISGAVFSQASQCRVLFALDVVERTAAMADILGQEMKGVNVGLSQRAPGYESSRQSAIVSCQGGKKRSKFGVNKLPNFATHRADERTASAHANKQGVVQLLLTRGSGLASPYQS